MNQVNTLHLVYFHGITLLSRNRSEGRRWVTDKSVLYSTGTLTVPTLVFLRRGKVLNTLFLPDTKTERPLYPVAEVPSSSRVFHLVVSTLNFDHVYWVRRISVCDCEFSNLSKSFCTGSSLNCLRVSYLNLVLVGTFTLIVNGS